MKLKPIITSLLQQDAYKFNMGNVICNKYSAYTTKWAFKCRNKDVEFTPEMIEEISAQIDHFCNLRFEDEELDWLKVNFPWLKEGYINFLKFWHPIRSEIKINEDLIQGMDDSDLAIEAEGTWLNTSLYEIPVLAVVNEVYFAFKYGVGAKDIEFQENTIEKFGKIQDAKLLDKYSLKSGNLIRYIDDHPYYIGTFAEFGMRRRYSSDMQDWLVKYITEKKIPGFVGTSNVYLAKKYNVKAVGTQAHEYFMAYQGNPMIAKEYSNHYALKDWIDMYETRNGIALTDTLGTELFLKDFGLTYATLFNGVRHDSGDPIEWGETMISHYEKLGIDPKTKTLLFSDSLNFEKATEIKKHFEGRCKVSFGIGTYLSNPLTSVEPLNIVMKMVECNGYPCAKLSNCEGKCMCKDEEYIDYLKRCIDWRLRCEK